MALNEIMESVLITPRTTLHSRRCSRTSLAVGHLHPNIFMQLQDLVPADKHGCRLANVYNAMLARAKEENDVFISITTFSKIVLIIGENILKPEKYNFSYTKDPSF